MTPTLHEQVRALFAARPDLRLEIASSFVNRGALDLEPLGVRASFHAAEREPEWVARYHALNKKLFTGALTLPGWVLADVYVLGAAITILTCDDPGSPGARAIAAAYVALPGLEPGVATGVSAMSFVPGQGFGAWTKILGLRALRRPRVRGIVQWASPSLRMHTRLGPLRVLGPAPEAHDLGPRSLVYELDTSDDHAVADAMARRPPSGVPRITTLVPSQDVDATQQLAARAADGERIHVEAPGIERDGRVHVSVG